MGRLQLSRKPVRALDSNGNFAAPADSSISPTYVPDLVHASLDLLMDGESDVWHVANEGVVTWFDCAGSRRAQRSRGGLIVPVETAHAWGSAARPLFSALSSQRGHLLRPWQEALDAYLEEAPQARIATGTDGCALG